MQEQESGPSVLEYLSFEAEQTSQEIIMTPSTPAHRNGSSSSTKTHMQGILWKRRDVFRNRWRSRFFVLHPEQRVLTYYLLANQDKEQIVSGGNSSVSSRRRRATTTVGTPLPPSSISFGSATSSNNGTTENREFNRRRTFSESSSASINTIDCDVVPRGTIYLPGSTVEANEVLTRPRENLYALTIANHETGAHCHLSARTENSRNEWIHHIRRVCQSEVEASHQEPQGLRHRTPSSSEIPGMNNSAGRTKIVRNELSAHEDSENNNQSIDSNNAVGGQHSKKTAFKETDILVLCAPLILYEGLTMMSQFRLAALCFVPASILVLRWVLMQH